MTRQFCDSCDNEITEENRLSGGTVGRLGTECRTRNGKSRIHVEILTGMDGTANQGDFCLHCVLDALSRLDNRPKMARESS